MGKPIEEVVPLSPISPTNPMAPLPLSIRRAPCVDDRRDMSAKASHSHKANLDYPPAVHYPNEEPAGALHAQSKPERSRGRPLPTLNWRPIRTSSRMPQQSESPSIYYSPTEEVMTEYEEGTKGKDDHFDPPDDLPPRPPTKSNRASRVFSSGIRELKHLSITPGDMMYQPATLTTAVPEYLKDYHDRKASKALAHSRAIPPAFKESLELSDISSTSTSSVKDKPLPALPAISIPIPTIKTTTTTGGILPQSHRNNLSLTTPVDPQNGRLAWLHALTAFLVVFNCWGLSTTFGLFQAYYTRVLLPGTSPSTIAWIGSTQLGLVFGLGVPVGQAVDLGYFRLFFHGGSVLLILSVFLTAQCTRFWSLWVVQGLMTGLGMGSVFCSGVVVLMGWFDERKVGGAMGVAAAGSCVGAMVYATLARVLVERYGFATTLRIMGSLVAVTMVPANSVYRVRRTGMDKRRTGGGRLLKGVDWRMFTDPSYLFVALGMFSSFLGLYFGFVYIVSYGSAVLHLSDTASVNLLIFMSAANLPGRFVPALISDRCIGPLNTIVPSTLLSSAVIWLWAASTISHSSLIVIACFYGFVSAGIQVLYAPTVYSVCLGRNDANRTDPGGGADNLGLKAGGVFTGIGVACLIGTPIGGALIKYREDRGLENPFLGAQIFAGTSLLVGSVSLLASRVAKTGWAPKRA